MSLLNQFLSFIGWSKEVEEQEVPPPPRKVTKKELSDLTKRELVERARKEFDVKLNNRLKKQKLVNELFNLYKNT